MCWSATDGICSKRLASFLPELLERRLAGFDDQLAQACHDRDGHLGASMPYPDTAAVLKRLKVCGMRIGIVSDIHYHLAPHFDHYGLRQFVDSYTLSSEHGVQKPDPRLFQIALEQLGVTAAETLMVAIARTAMAAPRPLESRP
jgi:putative hydrolase of the HAD superfamily